MGEKGENNRRGRKKKLSREASREVVLGGEWVAPLSPSPGHRSASFARRYFFNLTPFILLPFPPQRSLVPGYLQQKSDGFYASVLLYLFPFGQWFLFHGGAKPHPKGIINEWQFWLIQNNFVSFNSFLTKLGAKIRNIRRIKMTYRMTPIGGGGADLFLTGITREQKIVAMNGFRCLLPLILIFS